MYSYMQIEIVWKDTWIPAGEMVDRYFCFSIYRISSLSSFYFCNYFIIVIYLFNRYFVKSHPVSNNEL